MTSPVMSPKVRRPSVSLDGIFSPSIRTRMKWMVIMSLPVIVGSNSSSLLWVSVCFAVVAGLVANEGLLSFGELLCHAGLKGKDLNKTGTPIIPESLGIAVGTVYLVTMFVFLPLPFTRWLLKRNLDGVTFPFELFGAYTAALLSITCMLLLGFADDVINLKWRHKVLIPAISSLPLLMIYSVTNGRTEVVVPIPLRGIFGPLLDLGVFYYGYMAMLAIFCTHSINILAGVNGVEVGQSLVIATSVVCHNLLAIHKGEPDEAHTFSLTLMFPFIAVSLALLRRNWWPAQVFVGDTYCYFAGMTFAVAGIMGHFGKTLLLFFAPQIFNFLYSVPQLFGLVPCPRHRLPKLDPNTGALEASKVTFELSWRNRKLYTILKKLALIKEYTRVKDEVTINNLTLLNFLLVKFGGMREDRLAMLLMTVQVMGTCLAFLIRHHLAGYFFP